MITRETIVRVIETLKGIDVRGFESMDKLVGLVMLFTNILNDLDMMQEQQRQQERLQNQIPVKEGENDGAE